MNKEKHIPDKPIQFALFASRPFTFVAVVALTTVAFAQVLGTSLSFFLGKLVDAATTTGQTGDVSAVLWWAAAYPFVLLVESIMWRTSGFAGMRWSEGARAYAYNSLFAYLSKHSHSFFINRFAGTIASRVNSAAGGMANAVESIIWTYTPTIISLVTGIVLISLASPVMGGIYLATAAILIPLNFFLTKKREKYSEEEEAADTKLRGIAVDIVTNMTAVFHFARSTYELARVQEAVEDLRVKGLRNWKLSEMILLINSLLLFVAIATLIFTSFTFWHHGTITTGTFVMIISLAVNLLFQLTFIGQSMNRFAKNYGETKTGLDTILVPHEIVDFPKAKQLEVPNGEIAFKKVGFLYGTRRVFKDFELVIPGGQRVGIVGPSGSGKTTFVSLLLRQQDVHEGEVQVDGQNIRKVTLDSLREAIAVVPQEPALFHRSIRENIAYGKPDATDEEVVEAARRAQAHDFVAELPEGYDTLVGERGVKLSGGQRQRIAIARAILKNAPILVLDEATSSLDSESEVAIQQALEELMHGKTVIAIAHRLSTIKAMDRIIVLEDGAIAEDGTHDSLVEAGGTYARLWNHQAGGFLTDE